MWSSTVEYIQHASSVYTTILAGGGSVPLRCRWFSSEGESQFHSRTAVIVRGGDTCRQGLNVMAETKSDKPHRNVQSKNTLKEETERQQCSDRLGGGQWLWDVPSGGVSGRSIRTNSSKLLKGKAMTMANTGFFFEALGVITGSAGTCSFLIHSITWKRRLKSKMGTEW